VAATESVLGYELNAVRLYDADTNALELVARTADVDDVMSGRPMYGVDEGHPWQVFETGDPCIRSDIQTGGFGEVRSGMYLPLGRHGTLSVGARQMDAFDEDDLRLAELLAETVATALDRTDREAELRIHEAVLDTVQDLVFTVDREGRLTMVTDPLSSWLGYERDDLIGMEAASFSPDDWPVEQILDSLEAAHSDETITRETRVETADGVRVPAKVELSPLWVDDRFLGAVGALTDLSELLDARAARDRERGRFTELFEHLPDPANEVEFVDGEPIIRAVNPAFERVFGYDSEEIVGLHSNDVLPPDAERDQARRLDGRALSDDLVVEEVRRKTAQGYRYFLFRGFVHDRSENPRAFGIYTDITDHRHRERRLAVLQRVLRHNLRNEMTVVHGHAADLAETCEDPEIADRLAVVADRAAAVNRLGEQTREMERAFDLHDGHDSHPVCVAQRIEAVCERIQQTHADADLTMAVDSDARVIADERLSLALENAIENACEHAGDRPTVTVDLDADEDWVTIRIADDGPGIPEHERAVVTGDLDVTQLTHGSGMGLWLVAWAIQSLGGAIWFDVDDGTTVTIHIPRTDAEPSETL
jgi:PAS domain S-box-containing protein